MQQNIALQFYLRYALQRLAQNLPFEFKLSLIRNMLVVAPAAALKIRTGRLDPLRRGLRNAFHSRPRETGLLLGETGFDLLTRQDKGHEYGFTAAVLICRKAGQPIAAVYEFLDDETQEVI